MKKLDLTVLKLCVVAGSIFAASTSQAALIPGATVSLSGTGIGAVATILTIHDNDHTEAGKVSWNGSNNVATGDVVGPNVQTQTQLLSPIGITSGADIQIIFNASEPGGGAIQLDKLILTIYSSGGVALFSEGLLVSPVMFANTQPGVGKSGFSFVLDNPGDADAAIAQLGSRIGLEAAVSAADGGLETFFILRGEGAPPCNPDNESCGPQETPEPGTLALLGVGLVGAGALRRRRKAPAIC